MKCESALKLFLFQAIAVFFAEANADSTFSRSSYFTTHEDKQLKGYVVKRLYSPNLLSCDRPCMRYAWCTSTNYKMSSKKDGKGTCEPNKHDISLINQNTEFVDQRGVTFSILLKGCLITSCLNGGSCFPDNEKQTFSCSCQQPWTGDRCEVKKGCPQDWVLHGNSCYHVIDTPTLKWSDARTTCQNLGGDLAIIRSQDENNFVRYLVKQQTVQDWGAWIGLYRKADNMFYWVDDTPLAGHYSAWAHGERDHYFVKCVHIYNESDKFGDWNNIRCILDDADKNAAPAVSCQKKNI